MAEKILYYLGAGASAQALPLARSVLNYNVTPAVLNVPGLAYELDHFDFNKFENDFSTDEDKNIINSIKQNFKTLAAKANEFGDVDTYAKYLNLMNQDGSELKQLKQTLSQYFAIKQIMLHAKDSRYFPWLVSIMERKIFPDNVKIISWNYDYQLELAASQIGTEENVEYGNNSFKYSSSMLSHFPNLDPTLSDDEDFSLIHLNGIAGFVKNTHSQLGSIFQPQFKVIEKALSLLSNPNLYHNLHFAWENSNYHSLLMRKVEKMIRGTTIIVVIGYSFPFFNREIDKQIIKLLMNSTPFPKIYYQDPVLNGQQLKSQFGLPASVDIIPIKNTDNFHIPFEY